MKWLLLTLNLGLHAAFIWGRFAVFRVEGRVPRGVRVIEISATASMMIGLALIAFRAGSSAALDGLAVAGGALSGALFAWGVGTVRRGRLTAAFSDDAPPNTSRPGRFDSRATRFTSLTCSPTLASRSGWALFPLLWMACVYRRAAWLEEEEFLRSALAGPYRRYAAGHGAWAAPRHVDAPAVRGQLPQIAFMFIDS